MTQSAWRHIAITGASSGLGAALALGHAKPDLRLSLAGRDEARLEAVARLCRAEGAEVAISMFDIRDAERARDWLIQAQSMAPLDVVYANAGLGGARALAGRRGEDGEAARAIIDVNLNGVINTAAPSLDIFISQGRGSLVLVGSLAGRVGLPHCPAYSASKAAVAVYADALRRLAAPAHVKIMLVEPGFIRTPMSLNLPTGGAPIWEAAEAAAAIRAAVAQGRAVLRFPRALNGLAHVANWLPRSLVDRLLSSTFQKSLSP